MNCANCGHPPQDHPLDINLLRLSACVHQIDDGTNKGTARCGCPEWR